jgi:hypothetical protein
VGAGLMIPEERLSTVPYPAPYRAPDDADPPSKLTDYELGGVALQDASQGLEVQTWTLRADPLTGEVFLGATSVPESLLFTAAGITEVSLAFDQNMRPFVAFVQDGRAKYRWFDTVLGANRITELDPADENPRCCMDDKRTSQTSLGTNDIILAYVRAGNLYYRQQRDRYETERLLYEDVPGRLLRVGMHRQYRLQFMFES